MLKPKMNDYFDVMRQLSDQGGSVEIRADDPGKPGPGITFKARVHAVEADGSVLLDAPHGTEANQELRRNVDAQVLGVWGATRIVGHARIRGVEFYQFNANRRIRALRLDRPRKVTSAQRRRFFRVEACAAQVPPVVLRQADPAGSGRIISKHEYKAFLHDLGGGGVGLAVNKASAFTKVLCQSTCFMATIRLPGQDGPLELPVKLVHMRLMPDNMLCLGFEFRFGNAQERRAVEDKIVRATTIMQREQIRRQRGA